MNQTELNVILALEAHRLWLKSKGKEGKRADLADANLAGANLRDANLAGANLADGAAIYAKSTSDAYVPDFDCDNEVALQDIRRRAGG